MGLLPVLTNAPGGTLAAANVHSNYESLAYQVQYTDDDDGTVGDLTNDLAIISATATADAAATSVAVTALPITLIDNSILVFWNGVIAVLSAQAAKGATSVSVDALSGAIPDGTMCYVSNVQYKRSDETNWRMALPSHPTPISTMVRTTQAAGSTSLEIDTNSGLKFPASGADVYVENERQTITARGGSGNRFLTVTRGVGGTSDVEHLAGSPVTLVGGTKSLYGFIIGLDAGQTYNVRVTVIDGSDEQVVTFSKAARADNIPAWDSLTPTHFVNGQTGSDSNNGTASGTPWLTLEKAVQEANTASAEMIIQVEGAFYMRPLTALTQATHRITFVAADSATCIAAVGDDREIQTPAAFTPTTANAGHPVVYDRYSAPTGSGEGAASWARGFAGTGVWQSQILNGITIWYLDLQDVSETTDPEQVYHLSYSPVSGADYAAAKAATPKLSAHWEHDQTTPSAEGYTLNTIDGFTKLLANNLSVTYGYWQDVNGGGAAGTNTSPARLFLRLQDDADPNEGYVWMGVGKRSETDVRCGFQISATPGSSDPGHRVSGLVLRGFGNGVRINPGAKYVVVDHCAIEACGAAVMWNGDTGFADADEITGSTIQYNRVDNHGVQWSDDPITNRELPWQSIKSSLVLATGGTYGSKVMSAREDGAFALRLHVAHTVIRRNTIIGYMNGINNFGGAQTDVRHCYNTDCYENLWINITDNPHELEGPVACTKYWDEGHQNCTNMFDSGHQYGPTLFHRCWGHEIGNWGVTDNGHATNPTVGAGSGVLKYGSAVPPRVRIWFTHTTCWTSKKHPNFVEFKFAVSGIAANHHEHFGFLNPIIRMQNTIFENRNNGINLTIEGGIIAGTNGNGPQHDGRTYTSLLLTGDRSIQQFREWDTRLDSDAAHVVLRGHTLNKLGGQDYNFRSGGVAAIDAALVGAAGGNLTPLEGLGATASIIDVGVPVPNFDILYPGSGTIKTIHYAGVLPDAGAIETGLAGGQDPPDPPDPPVEPPRRKAKKTRRARRD